MYLLAIFPRSSEPGPCDMSFLFIVFLQFGKQSVAAHVSGRSPNPMHRAMSQLDLLPADAWRRIVRFICVPVGIDAEPLTAERFQEYRAQRRSLAPVRITCSACRGVVRACWHDLLWLDYRACN